MFPLPQRQVEAAQAKKSLLIGIRQRGFDTFLFDFHPQDGQARVDMSETRRALERGPRVEAVAQVNKQGTREQAIGPREERWLVEQDKVVDAAETVRSGLPARELSLRLFGNARMWHEDILAAMD